MKKRWAYLLFVILMAMTGCNSPVKGTVSTEPVPSVQTRDPADIDLDTPQTASDYAEVFDRLEVQEYVYEDGRVYSADMTKAAGAAGDTSTSGHSETNTMVADVSEEDRIKTDGQYLYCLRGSGYGSGSEIQIVRVNGSEMKEEAVITDLNGAVGFYVEGDRLIVISQNWVNTGFWSSGGYYTTASFYDIQDRGRPRFLNSLNMEGGYGNSRIYDGYLYLMVQYTVCGGIEETDPETYIPKVGGESLAANCIVLPAEGQADGYLVTASVNLEDSSKFTSSLGVLTGSQHYYVTTEAIYLTETQWNDTSNTTNITRLSYNQGQIYPDKAGNVKGTLTDDFAMDEHNGYLRMVTTVEGYDMVAVYDDRTGKYLGENYREWKRTNSLYVLDHDLEIVGSLEGLAEEEQIYSARFMGDTGYFVTFRQTDPLFSVDLSDPTDPRILGELKIPGFSEYLHFYGENLLLGIGQDADPDTGRTKGLKLSMFDISDPTDVKEIDKVIKTEIGGSEAYSSYKAVMIDPEKNLFGFPAWGDFGESGEGYFVYSYEAKKGFQMRIQAETDGNQSRGAYIGDTVYVADSQGTIQAYDWESGSLRGTFKAK